MTRQQDYEYKIYMSSHYDYKHHYRFGVVRVLVSRFSTQKLLVLGWLLPAKKSHAKMTVSHYHQVVALRPCRSDVCRALAVTPTLIFSQPCDAASDCELRRVICHKIFRLASAIMSCGTTITCCGDARQRRLRRCCNRCWKPLG